MDCRLWGRTESDTTDATSQQQQPGGQHLPSVGSTFPCGQRCFEPSSVALLLVGSSCDGLTSHPPWTLGQKTCLKAPRSTPPCPCSGHREGHMQRQQRNQDGATGPCAEDHVLPFPGKERQQPLHRQAQLLYSTFPPCSDGPLAAWPANLLLGPLAEGQPQVPPGDPGGTPRIRTPAGWVLGVSPKSSAFQVRRPRWGRPGSFSARTADGLVPTALGDIRAWAPGSLEAKGTETG